MDLNTKPLAEELDVDEAGFHLCNEAGHRESNNDIGDLRTTADEVPFHGIQALFHHFRWRRHERITINTELLELVEAGNGRRQRGNPVVADVKFDEREEEANGSMERAEEVEVLADVEGFEADEVFEVVREGAEGCRGP
ncbi:hypothetical protein AHAS_Ahas18G0170400 [Arachis hypogaea]